MLSIREGRRVNQFLVYHARSIQIHYCQEVIIQVDVHHAAIVSGSGINSHGGTGKGICCVRPRRIGVSASVVIGSRAIRNEKFINSVTPAILGEQEQQHDNRANHTSM